jgi:hypothetical protein
MSQRLIVAFLRPMYRRGTTLFEHQQLACEVPRYWVFGFSAPATQKKSFVGNS